MHDLREEEIKIYEGLDLYLREKLGEYARGVYWRRGRYGAGYNLELAWISDEGQMMRNYDERLPYNADDILDAAVGLSLGFDLRLGVGLRDLGGWVELDEDYWEFGGSSGREVALRIYKFLGEHLRFGYKPSLVEVRASGIEVIDGERSLIFSDKGELFKFFLWPRYLLFGFDDLAYGVRPRFLWEILDHRQAFHKVHFLEGDFRLIYGGSK